MLTIQISRRLIQRQYPTIATEHLRQCQPDDNTSQHLLPSGAPTLHLHLFLILEVLCRLLHQYPIMIILLLLFGFVIRRCFYLYILNVLTVVDLTPYLVDVLVDLGHFLGVVFGDGILHQVVEELQVAD